MTTVAQHFGIDLVLWRVASHFNHLHIEFSPNSPSGYFCAGKVTPRALAFRTYMFGSDRRHPRFKGSRWGGDYNCRRIAGSSTWSQHAWGNAVDVMVNSLAVGDAINRWLRSDWDEERPMTSTEKAQLKKALELAERADARFNGMQLRRMGRKEPRKAGPERWGWRLANWLRG